MPIKEYFENYDIMGNRIIIIVCQILKINYDIGKQNNNYCMSNTKNKF